MVIKTSSSLGWMTKCFNAHSRAYTEHSEKSIATTNVRDGGMEVDICGVLFECVDVCVCVCG
jgi:hypothetical protein